MTPASSIRSSSALDRLGVALRPETDDDLAWLVELYAATRADELAMLPWPATVKAHFVAGQFRLQRAHYLSHHPDADRLVVLAHGQPVGRLYVDRTVAPWRLIDVAIDPLHRSAGIGAALLRLLQREGRRAGIDLHVARDNPRAARLYARLGFVPAAGDSATHARMAWGQNGR